MSITLSGLTNPCPSSCFDHVLHLGSATAQRLDQVVRFGLHHAHVVGTLDNQQRVRIWSTFVMGEQASLSAI
nr:hypothetical protein [Mycobacteroides abscessus]